MKGHVNTKNGEISIENQVIAKYAGICALGCFGIVGMAMVNMKDGIAAVPPCSSGSDHSSAGHSA